MACTNTCGMGLCYLLFVVYTFRELHVKSIHRYSVADPPMQGRWSLTLLPYNWCSALRLGSANGVTNNQVDQLTSKAERGRNQMLEG